MKAPTIISIVLAIVLILSLIGFSSTVKENQRLESDLCYSIKTNRIIADGYIELLGELNLDEKEIEEVREGFYYNLELFEDGNWMGCEE